MQFIDLVHALEGYVIIQADSQFPERFLTVCTRRNLDIWDLKQVGTNRFTARMSLNSFRQIRPVCYRTRTHLRILSRKGLPFLLHRYRKRKAALLGLVVALVFLWYTSCHIMGITVVGNDRIETSVILEHLSRSGIALGKTTSGIDASQVRNRMMRDLDELAWIGLNVSGSRIYVEVVERLEKEPGIDSNQPCHLVATKDGMISAIEARNGQTMVTVGSGVCEGDILVSGIMDTDVQGFRYVHAYGEVFARTTYTLTREYPLTYEEAVDTGKQTTRYTASVLGHRIPLFFRSNAPYDQYSHTETVQEYRLPIQRLPSLFLTKETYRQQTIHHKTRSASEALALAKTELNQELEAELPQDAKILTRELTHTLTERDSLSVTLTFACRENIAMEAPIDNEDAPATISE